LRHSEKIVPLALWHGLTLDEELLLNDELLLKLLLIKLLFRELLDGVLLLKELLLTEELLLDKELELIDEETKLLLNALLSVVGGGVLGFLLPPPPQAVKRANILLNKTMCFNINFPLSMKVMLLASVLLFFI